MMNVLMVCYYFPPLVDVGCKRSVALAEYFQKYGWNPFVLSVSNPDKYYCTVGSDSPPDGVVTEYSLSIANLAELFGKMNGVLARLFKLVNKKVQGNIFYNLLCIPDTFIGWIPLTVIKGILLIKKKEIQIVYVSCSPYSSGVIGIILKIITGKPLVVDFRDPFASAVDFSDLPTFRRKINKFIEKKIVEYSNLFVVTTEETRKVYLEQYSAFSDKIVTIHNGFDSKYLIEETVEKFEKFTIVYAGQFYFYDRRCDQYTDAFFKAMAALKKSGRIRMDNFQFLYFGDGIQEIEKIAAAHDVGDIVVCGSRRPYSEIVGILKRSHLQLLRIVKPMISTKLYEGISLDVPFLATIPKGEVEDIITRYSPSSYIVNEGASEKIADSILDAICKYSHNEIRPNKVVSFLEDFSRDSLSRKMMEAITKTTGH